MEKDHFLIILEDIQSKFNLVLEGHDILNRKIDRVAEDLQETRRELKAEIRVVNDNLNEKIDSVEARLNAKIDSVEARLDTKIDQVKAELKEDIAHVADELAAHRADTETHKLYKVKKAVKK